MNFPVKYHHRKSTARFLLLTGYLFFFTTQFNYKYYDSANFFVYKSGSPNTKTTLTQEKTIHGEIYRVNTQRPAHLSLDKRFSFRTLIKPIFTDHQAPVPTYIIITRKALPPPVVYSTPDLPTNSFRGPPTV